MSPTVSQVQKIAEKLDRDGYSHNITKFSSWGADDGPHWDSIKITRHGKRIATLNTRDSREAQKLTSALGTQISEFEQVMFYLWERKKALVNDITAQLVKAGLQLRGKQVTLSYPSDYVDGKEGAGVVFIASTTGRILLGKRSKMVDEPHVWGTFGGTIRPGEKPETAARREVAEETGYVANYNLLLAHTYVSQERAWTFHHYIAVVPYEFEPNLNWEHEDSAWFSLVWLPSPMHYGLKDFLANASDLLQDAKDTLFVDRPMEHRNRLRGIS